MLLTLQPAFMLLHILCTLFDKQFTREFTIKNNILNLRILLVYHNKIRFMSLLNHHKTVEVLVCGFGKTNQQSKGVSRHVLVILSEIIKTSHRSPFIDTATQNTEVRCHSHSATVIIVTDFFKLFTPYVLLTRQLTICKGLNHNKENHCEDVLRKISYTVISDVFLAQSIRIIMYYVFVVTVDNLNIVFLYFLSVLLLQDLQHSMFYLNYRLFLFTISCYESDMSEFT